VKYFVRVLNTHHNAVVHIGEADRLDEALELARQAIADDLAAHMKYAHSESHLYSLYEKSGRIPSISHDGSGTMNLRMFDHLSYASRCCAEMFTSQTSVHAAAYTTTIVNAVPDS
jgi:hypothetical protein